MSHTERSVQCCFKSNTYCALLGDAQQLFCGFMGNIFVYTILQNLYNILSNIYHNINFLLLNCCKEISHLQLVSVQKCWEITSRNPRKIITDRLSKKKSHFREVKKSPIDFQSCYIVTTFYFEDLDRNVVEWKVHYLSFKCSEVKVISFQKNNTQVKCTSLLSTFEFNVYNINNNINKIKVRYQFDWSYYRLLII